MSRILKRMKQDRKAAHFRKVALYSILGVLIGIGFFISGGHSTSQNIAIANDRVSPEWSEQMGQGVIFSACAASTPPPAPAPVTCTTAYYPYSSMTGSCTNTWTNTVVACSDGTQVVTEGPVTTTCPPAPTTGSGNSCSYSGYVPWGTGCGANYSGTIADGSGGTLYNTNAGYDGSTSYSCSNGTWVPGSGTCVVAPAPAPAPAPVVGNGSGNGNSSTDCTLPWGGSIASGVSVIAFQLSSVTSPKTCAADDPSETRSCFLGTLTGSYTNSNCVQAEPVATISASPTRLQSGGTSTIAWSALGVQSCSVSGPGLSSTSTSGSKVVTVTAQSTYTITCQVANSSPVTNSVTVNIVPVFHQF